MFGDDRARTQAEDADDAPRGRAEDRLSGWADRLTERMESFGDRFSEAMIGGLRRPALRRAGHGRARPRRRRRAPRLGRQLRRKDRGESGRGRPRARDAERHGWTEATATRSRSTSTATTTASHPLPTRSRTATAGRTSRHRPDGVAVATHHAGRFDPGRRRRRPGGRRDPGWRGPRQRRGRRASLETMGGSIAVTGHRGPGDRAHQGRRRSRLDGQPSPARSTRPRWAARSGSTGSTAPCARETMGGSVQVSGRFRGV